MSRILSTGVVDPDRVGSASFCLIQIRIGINSKQLIKFINLTFFQKISICCPKTENYDTFDTDDEKDKTSLTGNAVTKSKKNFEIIPLVENLV